ncbi:MAG: hypothetical protein ACI8P0_002056 [Planctomycetaceae bacterium]|jgi:hypothetical protein
MTSSDDNSRRLTALVAIIRAAHLSSDRDLERSAKRELTERFGMRLSFCDNGGTSGREVTRD